MSKTPENNPYVTSDLDSTRQDEQMFYNSIPTTDRIPIKELVKPASYQCITKQNIIIRNCGNCINIHDLKYN